MLCKIINSLCLYAFILKVSVIGTEIDYYQPEQVHIAFGDNTQDIVIVWTTLNKTDASQVEFGENYLEFSINGTIVNFTDGGELKRDIWIHNVTLTGLNESTTYRYHCGSSQGWSNLNVFRTASRKINSEVTMLFFGDMGNNNAVSLAPLQKEIQTDSTFDFLIHAGDFAYDMDSEDGTVGDQFMRQIEPIAAYLPYMTCPGNHEQNYNFSHYKNRFRMPKEADGQMFYSFDQGPVHLISINTEVYFYYDYYGFESIQTQYNWLVDDLKKATKNRAERPWIIIFGHRPMYCSTNDNECKTESVMRTGLKLNGSEELQYGIEELLSKYGVDIAFWAHQHCYEKLWPVYDYKVYNGSLEQPYVNPKATVHITSGAAGNIEGLDDFDGNKKPEWSAVRLQDYGYTRFKACNATHVYIEQVSVETSPPSVIDKFWIVQNSHKPFNQKLNNV